jgi:hypothetical protein
MYKMNKLFVILFCLFSFTVAAQNENFGDEVIEQEYRFNEAVLQIIESKNETQIKQNAYDKMLADAQKTRNLRPYKNPFSLESIAEEQYPDAYVEAQRVAIFSRLPIETVFKLFIKAKQQGAIGTIDFNTLAETFPNIALLLPSNRITTHEGNERKRERKQQPVTKNSAYEDFLDELQRRQTRENHLTFSMSEAATTNPDKFARMRALSKAAGIAMESETTKSGNSFAIENNPYDEIAEEIARKDREAKSRLLANIEEARISYELQVKSVIVLLVFAVIVCGVIFIMKTGIHQWRPRTKTARLVIVICIVWTAFVIIRTMNEIEFMGFYLNNWDNDYFILNLLLPPALVAGALFAYRWIMKR